MTADWPFADGETIDDKIRYRVFPTPDPKGRRGYRWTWQVTWPGTTNGGCERTEARALREAKKEAQRALEMRIRKANMERTPWRVWA